MSERVADWEKMWYKLGSHLDDLRERYPENSPQLCLLNVVKEFMRLIWAEEVTWVEEVEEDEVS